MMSLINNCLLQQTLRLDDIQEQGKAAIQAVRRAGHARAVGPHGHLHLIEYFLVVGTTQNIAED